MTLETAREVARLTKADMARALGVSTRTVFNWEHGRTPVPRLVILGYAAVTGIPEEDIGPVTAGSSERGSPPLGRAVLAAAA